MPPSETRKTTEQVKGDVDVVIARAQSILARGYPQGNTNHAVILFNLFKEERSSSKGSYLASTTISSEGRN